MSETSEHKVILSLIDEMTPKLKSISSGITSVGSNLSSFGKYATAGIAAVTASMGVMGAASVKNVADMEMLRSSMDVLTGSAEKGAKMFKDLAQFANVTPFDTQDLASASQTMLGFGVSAESIIPNLQMLGDISMGNKEKLSGLSLVYSQVSSQGKLMGQDLLQMINNGFNPLTVISQKTGESISSLKDKMAEGKITADMVTDAMKRATSQGGLFFGGMEKGSKTLSGVYSTLKDAAFTTIRSILGMDQEGNLREGSIIDRIKNGMQGAIDFFNNHQADIVNFFNPIGSAIQTFAGVFMSIAAPVFSAMREFFSDIENRKAVMVAVFTTLGLAIGAWAISVAVAMAPVVLTIGAIGTAVFFLYKAWTENWGGIQENTKTTFSVIYSFYNAYIVPLFLEIKKRVMEMVEWWRENWDWIKQIFSGVWQIIAGVFKIGWALFSGAFKIAIDIFTGNWKKAWEDVKSVFSNIWNGIKDIFFGIWGVIKGAFVGFVNGFIDTINGLIEKANSVPGVPDIKKLGHINSFAVGTNYVTHDQLAIIHEGEAIIPKKYNPAAGATGGGGIVINISGDNHFSGDADIEILVSKIKSALSREQERANWGIA